MKNGNKKVNVTVVVVCVIFVITCMCVRSINRSENYKIAVECLRVGDYNSALEIFEQLGTYGDSRQLVNYALALQSSECGGLSGDIVAQTYISRISESYNGELSEEIREFRRGR